MASTMERLIEPVVPALRRYAWALSHDRTAADDLVQDCLERAVSRWHQRRNDEDVRPWLFAILHNLAITRLRRMASRPRHVALDDVGEAAFAVDAPQEDRLRYRDLLAGLAQLSEDQRAVLLLVAVEELSYADVASVLGVPVGTVMSRLSRARDRLFKLMSGGPDETGSSRQHHLRSVK